MHECVKFVSMARHVHAMPCDVGFACTVHPFESSRVELKPKGLSINPKNGSTIFDDDLVCMDHPQPQVSKL